MVRSIIFVGWLFASLLATADAVAQVAAFEVRWERPEGASSLGVALAHLDGDTDIDAFVANAQGDSRVWTNLDRDPFIFTDSFESGSTSAWSSFVP